MANNFSRTLRALRTDGPTGWLVKALVAALLLVAWGVWFFAGRVTVLAVSTTARTAVEREVYTVEAPVAGRITRLALELDATVEEGQLLVELEVDEQRHRLDERLAEVTGLEAQIASLEQEIAGARTALAEWLEAQQADLAAARARYDEARQAAEQAAVEAERLESLRASGLVPEIDLLRARSEAERSRSTAVALEAALLQLEWGQRSERTSRRAELDNLEREAAQLAGERAARSAAADGLRQELELRRIRAPASGRLGEVAPLQAGSFVDEGDRLAAVVPLGRIRAVAEFVPADAVGRIRTGQTARLRLAGFPSTRFGSIAATVARVASETSNGHIRVELEVVPADGSPVPLEHGLPGTVEVEVERLSPAALVLRTAGKLLDRPAVNAQPPPQASSL